MAAGTGGHVFPALAVARELEARGHTVQWLGTTHGMENRLLASEDMTLHQVAIKGMRGNGLKRLIKTPFSLLAATIKAMRIIKAQRIDAVAGFGGYVAAPGGLAARLLGVPLIIHEQNAVAGMTNSYLAKLATKVLEAFPNTFSSSTSSTKVVTIGNPVRADIIAVGAARKQKLINDNAHDDVARVDDTKPLSLLVIGGSLGAQVLNENMPAALAAIDRPLSVTHQCGRGHLEATQKNYAAQDLPQHSVTVSEFIKDMASAFSNHDMLVCRAGASTVSEVAATGIPTVFVPLPHAVDDHQTANAKYLTEAGGGVLLPQNTLNAESLSASIAHLLDDANRAQMQQNALHKAMTNATTQAADVILACCQD